MTPGDMSEVQTVLAKTICLNFRHMPEVQTYPSGGCRGQLVVQARSRDAQQPGRGRPVAAAVLQCRRDRALLQLGDLFRQRSQTQIDALRVAHGW